MLLATSLLLFGLFNPAHGAVYTNVGVKPGDWAEYTIQVSSTSTATGRMRIDILNVKGTVVTLNESIFNSNNAVALRLTLNGDIAGPVGSPALLFFVIPANLTQGDPIGPGSPIVINETVPVDAAGSQRTCNHFELKTSLGSSQVTEDLYWDQATGLLVQLLMNTNTLTGNYRISSTNVFPVNSSMTGTVLLLGGGVAVVALVVVISIVVVRSRGKSGKKT